MGNSQGNEKQGKGKSPAKGKHFLRGKKSPGSFSKKHGRKKSGAKREFDKTPESDNVDASDGAGECAGAARAQLTVTSAGSATRASTPDSPSVLTDPLAAVELNQCYYSAESDNATLTPSHSAVPCTPVEAMPHDDAASSLSDDDKDVDSDRNDNEKLMGAILSGSRGERLERAHECNHDFREHRLKAAPAQSSFTVSRHRRVELQPVPAVPEREPPLHNEAERRPASASEPPPPESNVLRKVASLTLDRHSEPRVLRPKFVPEKLNFQLYEKFEGQMLLNWFISSVSDNSHLKNILTAQDLKNLGIQYCTHLLAAGVLLQIPDKDAPTENIFKPNLMYYWAHMEAPVSQPVTPGRLHAAAWPHDKDVFRLTQDHLATLRNENIRFLNQNNNDEVADINEAKVIIAQLKNKLLDLELQLEKLKLTAQIETINKNLEKCFPPDNIMKKPELVNTEVQTNELPNKPVITLPDNDHHVRTSVAIGSSIDVSSVACNTEIISNNTESITGSRSENIENYCKLNKIRDCEEILRKDNVSEHEITDVKIQVDSIKCLTNKALNTSPHSSMESSSEASFFSINNSTELINSKQESSSNLVRHENVLKPSSNFKNITEVLYLNNDKNNSSVRDTTTENSDTSIIYLTSMSSAIKCSKFESKEDVKPCLLNPSYGLEAAPPAPPLPEALEPTTDPPRTVGDHTALSPSPEPVLLTPAARSPNSQAHIPDPHTSLTSTTEVNLTSPPNPVKSWPPMLEESLPPPPPPMPESNFPPSPPPMPETTLPPPPLPMPEAALTTPPPPTPGMPSPPLTMSEVDPPLPPTPGMGPPPPPMPEVGPPPPPMPEVGPPPPPMPGMGPPPPPMPGMGPPPPPMPAMGPTPPPMPGMGPSPPPMTAMGPPPPPMPGMGPPPPPMPGMGPPPPPMPGMGPPPPPMPGMGPAPPPMPGMGPPPPPLPGAAPGGQEPAGAPPPTTPSLGPVPFPAPPVGGWNTQRASLRKVPVKPAAPMKPLYWTRILAPPVPPSQDVASPPVKPLWMEIEETSLDNIDEFTDLFSRQVVKAPVKKKVEVKTKIKPVKILESKRSQNVGILAQSLHVEFSEIENAIYNFDTSVVSLEALQQIYEMRPCEEEMTKIKEHLSKNPDIPLDKPEVFLHELSGIPNFAERISCFMFQAEFEDAVSTTMHKLDNLKHTCEFMMSSEPLKKVFAIILTLGNYMNGGNGQRGQADGFGLEILAKLKDVKSKRSNVTLLHFIVRTYLRASGGALGAALPVPEPGDVARAAALDFADAAAQLDALTNQLAACKEKTKKVIETDAQSRADDLATGEAAKRLDVFGEKMTAFLTAAEEKLKTEHENLEECRSKFLATVKFYQYSPKGGKPEECEPKDFFALWTSFCTDFKDIYKKEEQLAIKEKLKEAKKHQEERKLQSLTQPKKEGGLKARLQKISSTAKK